MNMSHGMHVFMKRGAAPADVQKQGPDCALSPNFTAGVILFLRNPGKETQLKRPRSLSLMLIKPK